MEVRTQLELCLYDQLDIASLLLVSLLFIAIPTSLLNLFILFILSLYAMQALLCFFYSLVCLQNFSGGLLWPTSRRNRVVTRRCSALYPSFRSRVAISRKCNNNGTWGPEDYSNCTAFKSAIPTLLISFEGNFPHSDAKHVVDNVSLSIFVHMYTCTYVCLVSLYLDINSIYRLGEY